MVVPIFLFDDPIVLKSMKKVKSYKITQKALYFVLRFACNLLERGLIARVFYNEGPK